MQVIQRTTGLLAFVALAAVAAMAAAAPGASAANAPKKAPHVTWRTADGRTVNLDDLAGHVVLVDFWASWCPPCKASFPALEAISREYRARGVEVIAVNLDERQRDADAFLDAHPHDMTVTFDPKGATAQAFGVRAMPSSFVIDRTGEVRFTHEGYTSAVDAAYRQEISALLSEGTRR